MPILPKIIIETEGYCNLRQVVQWIKHEIRPVASEYEPILGIESYIRAESYSRERKIFYAFALGGRINVLGRPGLGQMFVSRSDGTSYFESHGQLELIPTS